MGTLSNLNGITEPQIPASIARDTEVANAIANHVAATDPHPIYLTQAEGDGRYRQSAVALVDADIPAAIARDSEVTSAIASHVAAADPHPTYLTQTEGDGRYRQSTVALVDADIPAAIARDSEVTSAIASHVAAADPHPTYLTQTEGDGRYRQSTVALVDADIPAGVARDSEVTSAIGAHEIKFHAVRSTLLTGVVAAIGVESNISLGSIAPEKVIGLFAQVRETLGTSGTRFIFVGGGGWFANTPRIVNTFIGIPAVSASQLVGLPINVIVWHGA
ncbi:hypothetical protein [Microcoleus sp. bin38.metabat.b11b12b14.051]|uniref:hypothetical protein n=1 Tax=Microcoleus sp. bin38.metabat.b11b12b14.051 TaxID=2742709 RepID=UPI0025D5B40E|nr:hypothetical protein [Microcoleus sp. bin38.metabat.b11b12b14.051]